MSQPTTPGSDDDQALFVVESAVVDPFAHIDEIKPKNFGRIGTVRPTALLYTGGIGATVDLPHVAVMPQGLDAWDLAYLRLGGALQVSEPRLVEAVKAQIGRQVTELRRPPREEPGSDGYSSMGVPATVFPRWMRCTGCDKLAPFEGFGSDFTFVNTIKRRPDQAKFVHKGCRGRNGTGRPRESIAVPARYLVACLDGHLDEFPYWGWVHNAQGGGWTCEKTPGSNPQTSLRMLEWRSNLGPEVHIHCVSCGKRRSMRELTGTAGAERMPHCRGRHPHLGTFEDCSAETKFLLLGAANQWYPATVSLLVVPESVELTVADVAARLQGIPAEQRAMAVAMPAAIPMFKILVQSKSGLDLSDVADDVVLQALQMLEAGGLPDTGRTTPYTTVELRAPEWRTLVRPKDFAKHARQSDFRIREVDVPAGITGVVETVAAVDRLKKVNAFIGFTRIDPLDRVDDSDRLAPISRRRPRWVPATEDHGEGVFIRLREDVIGPWEESILGSKLWAAHRAAHRLNVERRTSGSSKQTNPDDRFEPPRFWAVHTLAHLLIRQMALDSGYGSASLTERIYAWRRADDRQPSAGFLISTTSPDSDGTLGGLVELSSPDRLGRLIQRALLKALRCSSDPVCSHRTPASGEDFLHGAACHFCTFNSETSCENANRFLDRRLLRHMYSAQEVTGLLDAVALG